MDGHLCYDFRRLALVSAVAVFVCAAVALLVARSQHLLIARGLLGVGWALVLHVATAVCALAAIIALWRRRYRVARLDADAQVSLILWGCVFAQYPFHATPKISF